MNIFIDSTLTVPDPFFKSNFNRLLLHICEQNRFKLFISKLVYLETRNKLESFISERLASLNRTIDELNRRVNNAYPQLNDDLENRMAEFDCFYKDLIESGILELVEYDNDILPILVERSIKRIKPFTEKKQEFRDCIIWLSYTNLAEKRNLTQCYLITNNTNDYLDDKDKRKLHPNLQQDSDRFRLYLTAKDLITTEQILLKCMEEVEVRDWVESEEIDYSYVNTLVTDYFYDAIFDEISIFIHDLDPLEISEKVFNRAYVELDDIDIIGVSEFDIDIISREIVISGSLKLRCQVEIQQYSNTYLSYSPLGTQWLPFRAEFSFSYSMDRNANNFEISRLIRLW